MRIPTALAAPVRWPRSSVAETLTSACASAACYRCLENVRVVTVVVLELRFGDVEREVLPADVVERADDRPLDDRPEALDGLSVDGADDVLAVCVADDLVRVRLMKAPVADPLVSDQEANLGRDGFADELSEGVGADVLDHARHDTALAADGAGNRRLARTRAA